MTIPFHRRLGDAQPIDIGADRCATILWVVWRGWNSVLAIGQVDATWKEVPITEHLRDEMRRAVPDKDMWIWPGAESRSSKEVLEPDGRTDIPIAFTSVREEQNEQDAHAIIECKRVKGSDRRLCREYVDEGVRRFVQGSRSAGGWPKYAANHAFGFMVAYLLGGSTAGAVAAINLHLPKVEHLRPSTIVGERWAKGSTHERHARLGPMVINHAFLPLPTNTP